MDIKSLHKECHSIKAMTGLADQAGSGSYAYDPLGRITTETRVISGVSKSIGYAYNLDGSLKSLTYPSGRIVNYAYDSAAHPLSAIDAGCPRLSNSSFCPPQQCRVPHPLGLNLAPALREIRFGPKGGI